MIVGAIFTKAATILARKEAQADLEGKVSRLVERYESFVLVEATDDQIDALRSEGYKVTVRDPCAIKVGAFSIDTERQRIDERGIMLSHPSYDHIKDPGPGRHHYIVQFIGPIKREWKEAVREAGGSIGDPLAAHSYFVEMDGRAREEVAKLPNVRWIGHYDPSYRLASDLLQPEKPTLGAAEGAGPHLRGRAESLPQTYRVTFHTPDLLAEALEEIASFATIRSAEGRGMIVSLPAEDAGALQRLSGIHGVQRIDSVRLMRKFNDVASGIMAGRSGDLPICGEGETIAVADTGLDTGDEESIHMDFRGRIDAIYSWPINPAFDDMINNPGADDGASDKDSGHGTHVAGSVLGDGRLSGERAVRGLAHGARLVFQAIEQSMRWKWDYHRRKYGVYCLSGIPDDLSLLFGQAYDKGARIHSNSWGGGDFAAYDIQSQDVDRYVWEHPEFTVLFAAGNDGIDRNRDGRIDLMSITPPATAKNCISVGASESVRSQIRDKYNDFGQLEFPRDPIASDFVADNPEDIAAFSGRGPCRDGRFKPDVVAPGTYILSTRSSQCQGDGWKAYDDYYMYMGGTSMATPLTAGAVALIREHLRKERNLQPSASLIKAALIHTASRKPYRYAAKDPGDALWDPDQGWGHVDLRPFLDPPVGWQVHLYDSEEPLETGEAWAREVDISGGGHPLKVTLAYSDYPGVPESYPSLVNNLNLIVTDPAGNDHYGNAFDPPFDRMDGENNVEMVMIESPHEGRYRITVLASEVREGPQVFSLVYSGEMG